MIDRAQHQDAVGGVLGDRNHHSHVGVVFRQRGLDSFCSLRAGAVGNEDVAHQGQRDASVRSHRQFGLHFGAAGKVQGNFVAIAKPILFSLGRLEVSRNFEGILLELRVRELMGRFPGLACAGS